jgi:hypothetical protein
MFTARFRTAFLHSADRGAHSVNTHLSLAFPRPRLAGLGAKLVAKAAACVTHDPSDRFVLIPPGSTKMKPLIGRPVKSISRACARASARSYPSGPTRTISSSPTIPIALCPPP